MVLRQKLCYEGIKPFKMLVLNSPHLLNGFIPHNLSKKVKNQSDQVKPIQFFELFIFGTPAYHALPRPAPVPLLLHLLECPLSLSKYKKPRRRKEK